jgi:hypothetical protein
MFSLGLQPRIEPPYPQWPVETVAIIEEAIRVVARQVRRSKTVRQLNTAKENHLTHWLQKALDCLLDSGTLPGYSDDVFERPRRGEEMANYNGKAISKKPDLAFYRQGNPAAVVDRLYDGWFCECKILDASHPLRDYLRDGIMRFVKGDYAWAMPAAQMIGYVRLSFGNRRAEPRLLSYMSRKYGRGDKRTCAVVVQLRSDRVFAELTGDPPVFATRHGRRFKLPNGIKPGDIELRHLWLKLA